MGQYSTEGVTGAMAYKRRYTERQRLDSFALVTVSGGATFTGIPNGTYTDAVTGDVQTVTGGTLTVTVDRQGRHARLRAVAARQPRAGQGRDRRPLPPLNRRVSRPPTGAPGSAPTPFGDSP